MCLWFKESVRCISELKKMYESGKTVTAVSYGKLFTPSFTGYSVLQPNKMLVIKDSENTELMVIKNWFVAGFNDYTIRTEKEPDIMPIHLMLPEAEIACRVVSSKDDVLVEGYNSVELLLILTSASVPAKEIVVSKSESLYSIVRRTLNNISIKPVSTSEVEGKLAELVDGSDELTECVYTLCNYESFKDRAAYNLHAFVQYLSRFIEVNGKASALLAVMNACAVFEAATGGFKCYPIPV